MRDEEIKTKPRSWIDTKTGGGITTCCRRGVMGLLLSSSLIPPPSSLSWAAHPFLTDDAGTQGAGNWQLELQAQRNRHDAIGDAGAGPVQQSSRATLFSPILTYGLRDNLDIALGLNHLRHRTTENGLVTAEASGASDTVLDLKWRFYEKNDFNLALKPALSLPTGDENRGLGTGRASWGVSLIADYEAEPWVFLANVAYARARFKLPADQAAFRSDLWRVSAGAEYILHQRLRLTGELGVRTNEARADPFLPGRYGQFAMLGVIYSPTKKIDFDAGVRKGLNRAETDTVVLAGATFRW